MSARERARRRGGEQTERDSSRLRSLTEHVRVHPLLHPPSLQNKGFSAVTMCAGGLPAPPPDPPIILPGFYPLPPALLFPTATATAGEVTWYSNLSPAPLPHLSPAASRHPKSTDEDRLER